MKKILLAAVMFCLTITTSAYAQTQNGASTASNNVYVQALAGGSGGSGTQNENIRYKGVGLNGTAINNGGYFAGANPCLVGVGGSASGGPFGFALNLGQSDEACTTRADAGALFLLHLAPAAVARMCEQRKDADAMYAAYGAACLGQQNNPRYKHPTTKMVTILSADGDINKAMVGIYPIDMDIRTLSANAVFTAPAGGRVMEMPVPGK